MTNCNGSVTLQCKLLKLIVDVRLNVSVAGVSNRFPIEEFESIQSFLCLGPLVLPIDILVQTENAVGVLLRN